MAYLRAEDEGLRRAAVGSLRRLTGQSFGFDPSAEEALRDEAVAKWEAWWSENRDVFEF